MTTFWIMYFSSSAYFQAANADGIVFSAFYLALKMPLHYSLLMPVLVKICCCTLSKKDLSAL